MTMITESAIYDALRHVQEPELGGDLVSRNMIRDLVIDGSQVAFTIELTTPACPLKDEIETNVRQALNPLGVRRALRQVDHEIGDIAPLHIPQELLDRTAH